MEYSQKTEPIKTNIASIKKYKLLKTIGKGYYSKYYLFI